MSERAKEGKFPTDYRALEREDLSFLRKFTSPPFLYPSLYTRELITYPRTLTAFLAVIAFELYGKHCQVLYADHFCERFNELVYCFVVTY